MKVKVISGGVVHGDKTGDPRMTRVIIAETGEPLEDVESVTWTAGVDSDMARLTVVFVGVQAEILTEIGEKG